MKGTGRSDLVDIEVQLHHSTEGAWKVSIDGNAAKAVWVPRAIAEMEPQLGKPHLFVMTIPEWKAIDLGIEAGIIRL